MLSIQIRGAGVALAAMAAAILSPALAYGDAASESYVATNATLAINALSAAGTPKERSAKFGALMDEFADVPAIAKSVLGRTYGRQIDTDPALKAEWISVFRDYAMASYETNLDRYRGSALKVTSSRDSAPNGRPCSAVSTQMTQKSAKPLMVNWYICRQSAAAVWKVVDVGLILGDSEVKLGLSQRAQFESFLDQNGGDMHKLIDKVKQLTEAMRAKIAGKA